MTPDGSSGHSAAFFGNQRDYWWNEDFLRLVVERLGLAESSPIVGVNSGGR